MNWNRYQENILKKWSSMAKTYSTMHSISSEYYSKWDKRLGIPVILLGAVAASSIFTTNSQTDEKHIWTYINGGIVLIMTGISGITKFLGTHEKQAKHTSASFKYNHISMDVDTVLSFPRSDRTEQPRQFINDIKLAILEVREHSPDIPTWLVSDYIKKLDKSIINTHTKVNRHRQGDLIDMAVTYKNSRSNTPPNKYKYTEYQMRYRDSVQSPNETDIVVNVEAEPEPEKQSLSPEVEARKISLIASDNKSKKTTDTRSLGVEQVYTDYLSTNDNVTKKIECISNQLECHDSESDTESEQE